MRKKKRLFFGTSVFLIILLVGLTCAGCADSSNKKVKSLNATFTGYFKDGVSVTEKDDVFAPDSQVYTFELNDGSSKSFKIKNQADGVFKDSTKVGADEGSFLIQNQLTIGEPYALEVQGNTIVGLEPIGESQSVDNGVVSYVPGERTLKNFLKTAVAPIGTLIIYGGGWDLQDVGAANEARTIGVDSMWRTEFDNQTVDYDWLKIYPHNGWNKDHSRGLDNCGYTGWLLYNTMYDTSLSYPGLVFLPEKLTPILTKKYAFGTDITADLQNKSTLEIAKSLKPGDIVASFMHFRIVVGVCDDDSIVMMDCATAISKTGAEGGGVQLVAINPNKDCDTDCEAYRLVKKYMKLAYPEWTERYDPSMKSTEICFDVIGAVRMDIDGSGMFSDPDGYSTKNAAEILTDIFEK